MNRFWNGEFDDGEAKCKFPDLPIISFSVMPKWNALSVGSYSPVFSIEQMQDYCDGVFVIDNQALYRLATKQFAIPDPTVGDLNFIANQMVNDVTSLFRYDDSIGFNVSSFLSEMTITPNLKYFTFSTCMTHSCIFGGKVRFLLLLIF